MAAWISNCQALRTASQTASQLCSRPAARQPGASLAGCVLCGGTCQRRTGEARSRPPSGDPIHSMLPKRSAEQCCLTKPRSQVGAPGVAAALQHVHHITAKSVRVGCCAAMPRGGQTGIRRKRPVVVGVLVVHASASGGAQFVKLQIGFLVVSRHAD
jgi:hypothetical protein